MSDKLTAMQQQFKDTDFKSDYKRDVTPAKGTGPTALSKAEMETVQLKNERARNPKEFDAAKAMYESATSKKKGGAVKSKAKPTCMARGGGIEVRGKTKGRMV
jgi:hypothetical protein